MNSLLQKININIGHVTISKMWTAVLPVQYSLSSTFWLTNDSKKETPNQIDASKQIWTKDTSSLIKNINTLISVIWTAVLLL